MNYNYFKEFPNKVYFYHFVQKPYHHQWCTQLSATSHQHLGIVSRNKLVACLIVGMKLLKRNDMNWWVSDFSVNKATMIIRWRKCRYNEYLIEWESWERIFCWSRESMKKYSRENIPPAHFFLSRSTALALMGKQNFFCTYAVCSCYN